MCRCRESTIVLHIILSCLHWGHKNRVHCLLSSCFFFLIFLNPYLSLWFVPADTVSCVYVRCYQCQIWWIPFLLWREKNLTTHLKVNKYKFFGLSPFFMEMHWLQSLANVYFYVYMHKPRSHGVSFCLHTMLGIDTKPRASIIVVVRVSLWYNTKSWVTTRKRPWPEEVALRSETHDQDL